MIIKGLKLGAILLWGILIGAAYGQNTTTSSSGVVDSDSITWANGSWNVTFRPNPNFPNLNTYLINGTPLSPSVTSQNGALSSSGTFSTTVYDNSIVTPGGSSWTLTICPQSSAACSTYIFSAIGSSMDLTAAINSIIKAPRFPANSGQYGYADIEAIMQNQPGATYYSVTSLCQRVYSGPPTNTWSCTSGMSGATLPFPGFVYGTSATGGRVGTASDIASINYTGDTGTANAYVVNVSPSFGTPNTNTTLSFLPASSNSISDPTVTVNGFGPSFIQLQGHLPLVSGDIELGLPAIITFGPGGWTLQNPLISGHANTSSGFTITSSGNASAGANAPSNLIQILSSGYNSGVTLTVTNSGSGYTPGNTGTVTPTGGTCSVEPILVGEGAPDGTLAVGIPNPGICTVAPTSITLSGFSSGSGWAGTLSVADTAEQTKFLDFTSWVPGISGGPSLASPAYMIQCPTNPPTTGPCVLEFINPSLTPYSQGYRWFTDAPTGSFAQDSLQLLSNTRTYKEPDASGVRMVIIAIVGAANCGSLSGSTGCYEVNDGTGIHYIPKW